MCKLSRKHKSIKYVFRLFTEPLLYNLDINGNQDMNGFLQKNSNFVFTRVVNRPTGSKTIELRGTKDLRQKNKVIVRNVISIVAFSEFSSAQSQSLILTESA